MKQFYISAIRLLFIYSFCFFGSFLHAQEKKSFHSFEAFGGKSRHGSGDMKGYVFGAGVTRELKNRFSLKYNIAGTINNQKHTIIVDNGGNITDASIRFTTAGVQLGVNAGYGIVKTPHHDFIVSLGIFGRYQSASNGDDGYSLYGPQTTGLPVVLVGYNNHTPQETIALGGLFQLQYNYVFKSKCFLGIAPGFQTDTHGDAIVQAALVVGKKL